MEKFTAKALCTSQAVYRLLVMGRRLDTDKSHSPSCGASSWLCRESDPEGNKRNISWCPPLPPHETYFIHIFLGLAGIWSLDSFQITTLRISEGKYILFPEISDCTTSHTHFFFLERSQKTLLRNQGNGGWKWDPGTGVPFTHPRVPGDMTERKLFLPNFYSELMRGTLWEVEKIPARKSDMPSFQAVTQLLVCLTLKYAQALCCFSVSSQLSHIHHGLEWLWQPRFWCELQRFSILVHVVVWMRLSLIDSWMWTPGVQLMPLWGRFRKCDLDGRIMALEVGFENLGGVILSILCLICACSSRCEL